MFRGRKIRLLPTKEQELLFWKSAGTARWAYNYFLAENEAAYRAYLKRGKTGPKRISADDVRKYINNNLKKTTHQWLKEVSNNVMKMAVKKADYAVKKFLKGLAGKPKFKTKHRTKPSFYVNYASLARKNGGFHGERLGFIRTAEPLPRLPKGKHCSDPWISFDGKYWYLGLSYEVPTSEAEELSGDTIGIDLGIKTLATCYVSGTKKKMTFQNINRTKRVRRLEKKLRREQRKQSRKLVANTARHKLIQREGKKIGRKPIWKRPLHECRNLKKQRRKIALIHRRLANIRQNHVHQTTATIVKTKPSRVVLENLNVKGLMKNKHLAKAISGAKFYEFRRQMIYKCEEHGIQVIIADRFYPSSKTCSYCGYLKKDLRLNDRVYVCPACGKAIDRDLNAAINLANYFQSDTVRTA